MPLEQYVAKREVPSKRVFGIYIVAKFWLFEDSASHNKTLAALAVHTKQPWFYSLRRCKAFWLQGLAKAT